MRLISGYKIDGPNDSKFGLKFWIILFYFGGVCSIMYPPTRPSSTSSRMELHRYFRDVLIEGEGLEEVHTFECPCGPGFQVVWVGHESDQRRSYVKRQIMKNCELGILLNQC